MNFMRLNLIATTILSLIITFPASYAFSQPDGGAAPPTAAGQDHASKKGQHERVVMAVVGDHEITVEEFMRFISKDASKVPEATHTEGKARLLKQLIIEHMLMQQMRKEGYLPADPKISVSAKDNFLASQKFAAVHFPAPPVPEEETIYEYYQRHKEEYGIPEMVRVSQIQLRIPEDANTTVKESIRKKAGNILTRIEEGGNFAEVAHEYTDNPIAEVAGGDLGYLPLHADKWLENALEGITAGNHTGVLESPSGYEILKVTDTRKAIITPYSNIRNRIVQQMRKEAQEKLRDEYARELAKTIPVKIVMEGLENAMP